MTTFAWGYRPIQFMQRCARNYGEVFSVRYLATPTEVVFSNPKAIREIFNGPADDLRAGEHASILEPLVGPNSLLVLDGDRHLEHRRLMLPPFHGERMRTYGAIMERVANEAIDRFRVGEEISLHPHMQRVTLEIILHTVFGLDDHAVFDALRQKLGRLLDLAGNPLLLLKPLQRDLGPLTPWPELERLFNEIDEILYTEFRSRRAEGLAGRDDVLSMLLDATHEDGSPMSDEELRDEMITILIAGHETTTTALAWAVVHILQNPLVQERLRDELAAGGSDYLDAVIKETLRLTPVIPEVGRRVKRPMQIAGVDLPAGVVAVPSIYLAHHRPDSWPEPSRFDPERFMSGKVDPYRFFPFGGGRRRGIGAAFAMYELRIVLRQLVLRTRMALPEGYIARIKRRAITFAPQGGAPVIVTERR